MSTVKPHNCRKFLYELLPSDFGFEISEEEQPGCNLIRSNDDNPAVNRFITSLLMQLVPPVVIERVGVISEGWQAELRQVDFLVCTKN